MGQLLAFRVVPALYSMERAGAAAVIENASEAIRETSVAHSLWIRRFTALLGMTASDDIGKTLVSRL
jgi:hypothetical protein